MSRPVIIRKGSNKVVKNIHDETGDTLTNFGTQYHFLNTKRYELYDWCQNTDPAYINTGIKPRSHWIYEGKIKITDSGTLSQWFAFFGAADNITYSGNSSGVVAIKNTRYPEVRYYYNGTIYTTGTGNSLNVGDVYEFKIDGYNKLVWFKVNNYERHRIFSNVTIPDIQLSNGDMYIFGRTWNYVFDPDRNGHTVPCKIYYIKITDGDTNKVIHHWLPAVQNKVHGMIDTVTGQFYTNANSSGTLTCGND